MNFLTENQLFSFQYGEKSFWEHQPQAQVTKSANSIIRTYRLPDGLTVTNIAKKYEK